MRIALAGPARFDELGPLVEGRLPGTARPISGGSPLSALALALHARGHEVIVATLAHGATTPQVHRGDRFELRVGPYRPRHRARDLFAAERRVLVDALRTARPDVIHAHWTYEFAWAALDAPAPTVVTVRDWAPTILRLQPHPYRLVRLLMAGRVLRRAPRLTVTSPYLQARVSRWARGDVELIPNAIADEDFLPSLPPWSPDPSAPSLVAVNNGWDDRKNVATLLDAFARLRGTRPGARLLLVGHGYEEGGPAAAHARSRGAAAGVSFLGPLPYREAMARMAEADVFVHPSREESFGLVLVEAMARGVPVVAGADSGAVPWVCADGRSALLVDVGSPAALVAGIGTVLDGRKATVARRQRAHADALDRFALSAVTDRYEAAYRSAREEAPWPAPS